MEKNIFLRGFQLSSLHSFQIKEDNIYFEGPGQVDILDRKLTESRVRNLESFHIQHDWLFPAPPPSWKIYFTDLMREISLWPTVCSVHLETI